MRQQQTPIVSVIAVEYKRSERTPQVTLNALLDFITALWLGFIGACIGSFLNVVAYRMPLGMSVIWKPSHCPNCKHQIRAYDNVPVLGWLWLKGKCRDCSQPISPRYAIVEFVMGLTFFVLAYVELFTSGANLPGGPITELTGAVDIVWTPQWQVIGVFAYHTVLLSLLMSIILIDIDAKTIPSSLTYFAAIVGLVFATMGSHSWIGTEPHQFGVRGIQAAISKAVTGAICGIVAAMTTSSFWRGRLATSEEVIQKESALFERRAKPFSSVENVVIAFALVGLFLGALSTWYAFLFSNLLLVIVKGILSKKRWEKSRLLLSLLYLVVIGLIVWSW